MKSIWERPRRAGWADEGSGDEEAERLAHQVIGACIEVHRLLGPGLPEGVYEKALSHELTLRSIPHETQASLPVVYKGVEVGRGRLDVLVGGRLILELKSCEQLNDLHRAQLRAYLSATRHRLGLLINFNVRVMHDGIKRVINSH